MHGQGAHEARRILRAMGIVGICSIGIFILSRPVRGQAPSDQKLVTSDQYFKNVQILKGIPVDEFMDTMGFFAASTGLNCTDCHTEESGGSWPKYADDTPLKQRARMMMIMVNSLNNSSFAGKRMITCWTCHRGTRSPRVIPDLAVQYSDMPDAEPDELIAATNGVSSVDQIVDKYLRAIGGAQRVSAITSIVGKGTYEGYDTHLQEVPVELYVKAPDLRTAIIHTVDGTDTSVYNGQMGWRAAPLTLKPKPLIELTGGDLDGAKLDAEISFPAQIKQMLIDWRVGFPETIDNHDVQPIQGRLTKGGIPVKLYFDSASGLLVRMVRYTNTSIGTVPTQVDYSDYRDVSGVKMPFQIVVTWTDGRSTITLSDLRTNVPIETSKFAEPAPSKPESEKE